jgi:hypothetical protein
MTRHPRKSDIGIPISEFDAHIRAHGTCAICQSRDTQRHHGAAHCAGNFRRQHPTCTWDGRKPRFAHDLAVIAGMER